MILKLIQLMGFPGGASSKETACQFRGLRDEDSIPGSGRAPGVGKWKLNTLAWSISWTEESGEL